jgi:hypothetical protein
MAVTALVCVTAFNISVSLLLASDIVTVTGEVNETNQLVVDGEIYEVDGTPEGDELVKNYIHQKVEVIGKLRIEGDMRIIAVKSFKVITN